MAPEIGGGAQLVASGQNWSTRVTGTTDDYPEVRNFHPAQGDFFTKQNVEGRSRVIVLKHADFVMAARKDGWHVVLDAQYCPGCAADIQVAAEAAIAAEMERKKQLVQPVGAADALKWDGRLVNIVKAN